MLHVFSLILIFWFQYIQRFFRFESMRKVKAGQSKVKEIYVPTNMRGMWDSMAVACFHDAHTDAIRDRALELIEQDSMPEELAHIPDDLPKEEKDRRRRRYAQWQMQHYNEATKQLAEEVKDRGEWGEWERAALKARGEVKPAHIQDRNRRRGFRLLERVSDYMFKNMGVWLVIGYGFRDFEDAGSIITNM